MLTVFIGLIFVLGLGSNSSYVQASTTLTTAELPQWFSSPYDLELYLAHQPDMATLLEVLPPSKALPRILGDDYEFADEYGKSNRI